MFGTLGFSELIIILVIILIIFGAGRLPQIGEGVGKALKGFKKEVHEAPAPLDPQAEAQTANQAGQPPEEAQVEPAMLMNIISAAGEISPQTDGRIQRSDK